MMASQTTEDTVTDEKLPPLSQGDMIEGEVAHYTFTDVFDAAGVTWPTVGKAKVIKTASFHAPVYSVGFGTDSVSGQRVEWDLSHLMPDMKNRIKCPNPACNVNGEHEMPLIKLVQHLNDLCGWTREQIADWLETLDLDLTFPTDSTPPPLPHADSVTAALKAAAVEWKGDHPITVTFDEAPVWYHAQEWGQHYTKMSLKSDAFTEALKKVNFIFDSFSKTVQAELKSDYEKKEK